jgi:chromate transporter
MAGLLGAACCNIQYIYTTGALIMLALYALFRAHKVKGSIMLEAAVRGIRGGVIGMILAAAYMVASAVEMNWVSPLIFATSLLSLHKYNIKVEVALVIPAA